MAHRLSQARVVLQDAGGTGVDTLRDALSVAGLEIAGQRGVDDLSVVVADDFLDPRLEAMNQSALGADAPGCSSSWPGPFPGLDRCSCPDTLAAGRA